MLLSVNFKNILYVESEAQLLRSEEEIIHWSSMIVIVIVHLLVFSYNCAPFGLLIALFKVELFIWDIVDLFSKSRNHIEHQKNKESLLPHFTFFFLPFKRLNYTV